MSLSKRLGATVIVAAALSAAAAPASADAAKLRQGVYDCMRYDYFSGFLMYQSSVKLLSKSRYQHAFGRKKANLTKPTNGRYVIRGKKVKFKGGSMEDTPGRITKATQFDVWVDGQRSGITCYRVKKP